VRVVTDGCDEADDGEGAEHEQAVGEQVVERDWEPDVVAAWTPSRMKPALLIEE